MAPTTQLPRTSSAFANEASGRSVRWPSASSRLGSSRSNGSREVTRCTASTSAPSAFSRWRASRSILASDATRAAVLTALDVIGYERPTQLRSRKARMVGLVVPELGNPIFPALAEVVAGALAQRGFNAVLCTRTGSMSESEYVEMLLERQVSGMVFAGGQYAEADAPHDHYTRLKQLRLPVVLVNAAAEHVDFPRVSTDDAVAMEQAYSHLLYLGHTRIGLILGPPDHVPSLRKLAAYEQAVAAYDEELVERTRFSLEGGHAAATKLIHRGVTGIICASDPLALGAIRAARRAGLKVPTHLSVVG